MSIPDDVFDRLPPRPYEEVRAMLRDGDLLLCSARDAGSRAIRWATKSPWSHVAIGFRVHDIDRVLALECVERIGVRAVPLSDFIARTSSGQQPYPGKILLARHRAMPQAEDATPIKAMSGFAFDRLGARFSSKELVKIAMRIGLGRLDRAMPERFSSDDEYICSEYVARCYEQVGLHIQWDGRGFIAPADFAADPQVEAVAQVQTR
jgi:hypothetical protein